MLIVDGCLRMFTDVDGCLDATCIVTHVLSSRIYASTLAVSSNRTRDSCIFHRFTNLDSVAWDIGTGIFRREPDICAPRIGENNAVFTCFSTINDGYVEG